MYVKRKPALGILLGYIKIYIDKEVNVLTRQPGSITVTAKAIAPSNTETLVVQTVSIRFLKNHGLIFLYYLHKT